MNSSNWISVKDRLPKEHSCVVVTDGESVCTRFYSSKDKFYEWGSCGWSGYEWEFDFYTITHWMEIPELPLKVDDAK